MPSLMIYSMPITTFKTLNAKYRNEHNKNITMIGMNCIFLLPLFKLNAGFCCQVPADSEAYSESLILTFYPK